MGDQTLLEHMCSLKRVHQHLWTAEDMYWGQLAGACEAVSSGVTTILDHSDAPLSAEHVLRTLAATRESGVRCVYAYSKIDPRAWVDWQTKQIREIGRTLQASEDQRVTLGFGYDGIAWESLEDIKSTLATAEEAGSSLTTLHVAPTHMPRSLSEIHASTHALSSAFVFAHFNHPDPADVALVKKLGASVACTPETELAMGHGYCAAFSCAANGIKAGLGVDAHAVCSGDMFAQMRLALQSARTIRNASLYLGTADGLLPAPNAKPVRRVPRSLVHTAAHVVRFATLGGAETRRLNMADRIGSLEVGKLADISLISRPTCLA
jgi:cytosine/adenosine deaminase-related metal-dependent hydrolase